MVEDEALWRRAILNKYGQIKEWISNVVDSTYKVSVWRSIRNLWDSLKKNLVVKVGEGNKVFFWEGQVDWTRVSKLGFPRSILVLNQS